MTPKNGGSPLPPSPICLPRENRKAIEFLAAIEKAQEQAGWSRNQRQRLRLLHMIWSRRAEGRDPQFEQYGTFFRKPGTQPPTPMDAVIALARQRNPLTREERRRLKVPWTSNEAARQRAKRWRIERDERRNTLT